MICPSYVGVNDSFVSAIESNRKGDFLDPHVPKERRKKKNSGVKFSPDPSNRVDEEALSEENEQIPTDAESFVDSSGKGS